MLISIFEIEENIIGLILAMAYS